MTIIVITAEVWIGRSGPGGRVGGDVGQGQERRSSDAQNGGCVEQHVADVGLSTRIQGQLYG